MARRLRLPVSPGAGVTTPEHVELARAAGDVGLVVTRLMPMGCGHGPCYAMQLWQPDGELWAEGTHESAESVQRHIDRWGSVPR